MSSLESVVYVPGMGEEPRERLELPTMWRRYGLDVRLEFIEWTNNDYEDRIKDIGSYITWLFKNFDSKASIAGDSGGGQAVLSMFARYQKYLNKAVTFSTKMEAYDFSYNPSTAKDNPNLEIASDMIESDLRKLTPEIRRRILCVHPDRDGAVAPDKALVEGAEEHEIVLEESITKRESHIEGIRRGITTEAYVVGRFINKAV